jgi:hypothetical protein
MILIISEKSDNQADRVESILLQNAAKYSRLNLDVDSLRSTTVISEEDSFKIEGPNCSFSTSEIEAIWNRSSRIEQFIEKSCPQDEDFLTWRNKWHKTLEKLFSSLESIKWLNFYQDFYDENQFRHYEISKNIGLKWPSFICTNDINYLNRFFENKKECILALMDQGCKIRSSGKCSEKCSDKFGSSASGNTEENCCRVSGAAYQVRCSVVGKDYFVGKIKANAVGAGQTYRTTIQPPRSIKMQAIKIMSELKLTHGVFDFFVTPNDEWFFDALNPIGQYQWTEDIRGTDISSSIAKWLMINN